ncbi:MAG: NADH-quinone oxidoreductase subunit D [Deltaproteobacteria bacterium]|nr:NADH-quinone oxidoreductase subunit D [Deltaproteobacteria bacterium]
MEPIDLEYDDAELELPSEPMSLNMGPSHPAMHGTIRMVLKLDGETVKSTDIQPGYLHRAFEKMAERGTWAQVFPYTDRLNYCSPLLNNVGYALAVEKLLGITVPRMGQLLRVVHGELSRMADHLTCNGAMAMELGAFTPFLWYLKAREWIWECHETQTGARMTHSYFRIGGTALPATDQFVARARKTVQRVLEVVAEGESLLLRNRIFLDRTQGIGVLSRETALAYGVSGPMLRGSGVDYDVRKDKPYLTYGEVDFDVPIGEDGDTFDRFMVRSEELRQSARIIEQTLDLMEKVDPRSPDAKVSVDDPRVMLPPKSEVYGTIEGTINHFKLIMEGVDVPAGEAYAYTEGGNGELGFFVVSRGGGTPWRVRVRSPCFYSLQSAKGLIEGGMLADIVPIFGSVNMIGGECDR